jgi:hypothetical protein
MLRLGSKSRATAVPNESSSVAGVGTVAFSDQPITTASLGCGLIVQIRTFVLHRFAFAQFVLRPTRRHPIGRCFDPDHVSCERLVRY